MKEHSLYSNIAELAKILIQNNWLCATAESCTGGLLGAAFTSISGASSWYSGGFITYSNELKCSLLSVPKQTIKDHGAVSEQCVKAMVKGLCKATSSQVGIAISGIAGPGGGTAQKPVGTIWLGFAVNNIESAQLLQLKGDREKIRKLAVEIAILGILERVNKNIAK